MGIAKPKVTNGTGEVRQFDRFALPTGSIERSEKFYTEVLGLRTIVKCAPRIPGGIFMKSGAKHHLGFFEHRQVNTGFMPKRETIDGFPRVALAVPSSDFAPMVWRIRNACAIVEEIGESAVPGGDQGLVFVDPEGNIMEVLRSTESPTLAASHCHF